MMPDYKEMYFKMMRASEAAIRILIAAQRECEEMYLKEEEPSLTLLPTMPIEEISENSTKPL